MRILLTLWRENERLRQERDEFARAIVGVDGKGCWTHDGAEFYLFCPFCESAFGNHNPDCIVLKADAIKKQEEANG